ncbi:CobW family GTP-binding protein [Rhizobium sp. G21]|uniref:CobW family GTP-binding protein n=1 Tax=Rhizobium sp. G21 TaxID=2758439 RepID=UPI0015FF1CD0|nr:GTP-binding protein [Rhizobium sp. G21]MBB1249769.1 GTP-binding protein [Rhizobium sp. G21]
MAAPADRIPVSILTGFLGAGKSTLLNRLLKQPEMADAAVIINEFGEVGIDHLLVEASDSVVELSNGCLCCTVRGELTDTLMNFHEAIVSGRMKPLSRVVIETTGLADPAPVIQSIIGHPDLARVFSLDGVITVADAVNGVSTLERHEEARRQAALADRLILSKKSLASDEAAAALIARLRGLNPRAELIDGDSARASAYDTFSAGLFDPRTRTADAARWLADAAQDDDDHVCDDHCGHDHHRHLRHHNDDHPHHGEHDHHHGAHHHHDQAIRSFSITHDRPIDPAAIGMFVDLLRSAHAERLLRMKAIVQLSDDPDRPLVLHGVQSVFHQPERLASWPGGDRRTRMVLITQDLDEDFVRSLFDAFTGRPRIDRPDRQALEDNPLAIPGLRL